MSLKTESKRIFGLDIFRTIAITLVVISHGEFMLKDTFLEGFGSFKTIDGVDVFFVLSGFLIGGILLKEINKSESFRVSDLLNFWKRRWFRTLPNYYLILLLNYLVVKYGIIDGDIEQFSFHFIFFTQNFKSPFHSFFWESWSLSIEEWFYIITPLLIFISLKVFRPKHSFLLSTLTIITVPLIYRMSIYHEHIDSFWWDVIFRRTVLARLDSIGYGLLLAWSHFYYFNLWRKLKLPSFLLGIALMVLLVSFDQDINTFYKQTIFFSLVPFSVMFLLPMAEGLKKAEGFVPYAIQHISKISYSMYLINLALVAEVIRNNFPPIGRMDGLLKYLFYWMIVVFASTLLYKYFEKPMMDLRDRKR